MLYGLGIVREWADLAWDAGVSCWARSRRCRESGRQGKCRDSVSGPLRKVRCRCSCASPSLFSLPVSYEHDSIYSPMHAFLWQAISPSNWILIFILLGLTSAQVGLTSAIWSRSPNDFGQLHVLNLWYARLLKDREILAAEVMHEYNKKVSIWLHAVWHRSSFTSFSSCTRTSCASGKTLV